MKIVVVTLSLICLLLTGCNTVGPYTAKVYRIEASVFLVGIDTWLGRDQYSVEVQEQLKKTAESLVKKELTDRGLVANKCVFLGFTPFQGGHTHLSLIAGEGLAVNRWVGLSEGAFNAKLKTLPLPEVIKFDGVYEVNPTSQPKHGEDQSEPHEPTIAGRVPCASTRGLLK